MMSFLGESFGGATSDVVDGGLVESHTNDGDLVECSVGDGLLGRDGAGGVLRLSVSASPKPLGCRPQTLGSGRNG